MATVREELSAGIKFGAMIDPSWTRSVSLMQKSLNSLEKESQDLTKQQGKLRDNMRIAAMSGKVDELKKLTNQYEKLTKKIKATEDAESRLNRQVERRKSLDAFAGKTKSVGSMMTKTAGFGVAGSAGLFTGAIALNNETYTKIGQAKAYGIDPKRYMAMGKLAQGAGLTDENYGDVFEEYKNKVQDYRSNDMKKGDLYDVLTALNYKQHELAGKTSEEQMMDIMDRLSKYPDAQKAAGLADMVGGGEMNKIITYLHTIGKSFSQALEDESKYIMLSDKGIEGSEKGQRSLGDAWSVIKTASMEVSGMTLGELSGDIDKVQISLREWFKNGGLKQITDFIVNEAIPAGKTFAKGLYLVSQVAYSFAKKLAWIVPDEKSQRQDVLKAMATMGVDFAKQLAKDNNQEDWFNKILKDNPNIVDENSRLYKNGSGFIVSDKDKKAYGDFVDGLVNSGDSGFKDIMSGMTDDLNSSAKKVVGGESFSLKDSIDTLNSYDKSETKNTTENKKEIRSDVRPTINIYQLPGESGEDLSGRVINKMNGYGMYDEPEV